MRLAARRAPVHQRSSVTGSARRRRPEVMVAKARSGREDHAAKPGRTTPRRRAASAGLPLGAGAPPIRAVGGSRRPGPRGADRSRPTAACIAVRASRARSRTHPGVTGGPRAVEGAATKAAGMATRRPGGDPCGRAGAWFRLRIRAGRSRADQRHGNTLAGDPAAFSPGDVGRGPAGRLLCLPGDRDQGRPAYRAAHQEPAPRGRRGTGGLHRGKPPVPQGRIPITVPAASAIHGGSNRERWRCGDRRSHAPQQPPRSSGVTGSPVDCRARRDLPLIGPGRVEVGDLVRVRRARIPVDGEVVAESAAVDESMLAGESVPVSKTAGDPVAGAAIDMDGRHLKPGPGGRRRGQAERASLPGWPGHVAEKLRSGPEPPGTPGSPIWTSCHGRASRSSSTGAPKDG